MRAFELSTFALTVLAAGMPWLFACASAPRPAAAPSGASAAAPGGATSGGATSGAAAAAPGHTGSGDASAAAAEADPHSFARPSEVAVDHLVLDLSVDFAARRLSGRASLRLRSKSSGADTLYLDTRDLDIQRVTLEDGKTEAPFTLGDPVPHLGRSLAIRIPPGTKWI
ncbi:MAG TPA: hypothetical protein VHB47_04410, partial [Thermoanaerobaculia bacterium]|nr:hypothetical protein [Thermoanaerobaculia bacterium]